MAGNDLVKSISGAFSPTFNSFCAKLNFEISTRIIEKINFDTVQKIGDRYFSIIAYEEFDKRKAQFFKTITAFTTIRGNIIHFDYQILSQQKDSIYSNFIQNSIILLETIRISNGR